MAEILDAGQFMFFQAMLMDRARAGARYAQVSTFNATTITNMIVYNDPNGGSGAGLLGLQTSMVTVHHYDTGLATDRIEIIITNFPLRFYGPMLLSDFSSRVFRVVMPSQGLGATSKSPRSSCPHSGRKAYYTDIQMRHWLVPSIADVLLVAVFVWLFAGTNGWSGLLADGDTGWHIRNGQLILERHSVPHQDWFGFGADGHAWFAWEWLADVVFALLHRAAGLKGVVYFSGLLIAATQWVAFRHCMWRGVNPLTALAVVLAATNAASIHFLARPHVFTLLFVACAAWLLDRDRSCESRSVWLLPGVVAIWTNLHGGFLAVFTILGAT